jgi:rod shape-determining protein MreD
MSSALLAAERPRQPGPLRLAALLTALAAVLVDLLPLPGASGAAPLAPSVTLCVVYFWVLQDPDLLPPVALFALGLSLDALGGMPLGLNALALLLVRSALPGARRLLLKRPFVVVWLGFALTALAFDAVRWAVAGLWWQRLFPPQPSLVEALLTFAAYPPVGWLLARLHHGLGPRTAHAAGR